MKRKYLEYALLLLFVTCLILVITNLQRDLTHDYPLVPITTVEKGTATHQSTLLELTNIERTKAGLPIVQPDTRLEQTAAAKCADMAEDNYWSHDNPNGTKWQSFITVPYAEAGENLSRGYKAPEAITKAWMDSPTHRANILDPDFQVVGFASCRDEISGTITVQHFIRLP